MVGSPVVVTGEPEVVKLKTRTDDAEEFKKFVFVLLNFQCGGGGWVKGQGGSKVRGNTENWQCKKKRSQEQVKNKQQKNNNKNLIKSHSTRIKLYKQYYENTD